MLNAIAIQYVVRFFFRYFLRFFFRILTQGCLTLKVVVVVHLRRHHHETDYRKID
jgi:hypothetical protein